MKKEVRKDFIDHEFKRNSNTWSFNEFHITTTVGKKEEDVSFKTKIQHEHEHFFRRTVIGPHQLYENYILVMNFHSKTKIVISDI